MVLVPDSFVCDLAQEELYTIFLHELAHVRSKDYAVNVLERTAKPFLFFHPLVWFISRELRALREEICDDDVLNVCSDRLLYAKVLTEVAGRNLCVRQSSLVTLCSFNHRALIERRVEHILASERHGMRRLRLRTALALLSASLAMVGCLSLLTLAPRMVKGEGEVGTGGLVKEVSASASGGLLDKLPGKVVFEGVYNHRSRGGDYGTSRQWVKQDESGAITAVMELRSTTYVASGNRENRITEYRVSSAERELFEWILGFEKGKVVWRKKSPGKKDEVSEIPVPEGQVFDPNSRPDPYCAANILLRSFALKKGESKEVSAYDWDNSGKGMASYSFRVENKGKEEVSVPAGVFEGNHIVLTQLTTGDTWYKKRAGHVTDFWVLDNNVIVRILRHREPYELLLAGSKTPAYLPGLKEQRKPSTAVESPVATPVWAIRYPDEVYCVAFTPDGKGILAGSADGTLKLRDVKTGEEIRSYPGHAAKVASVVFSSDGQRIVTGSWDSTAKLWDAATAEVIRTFSGHRDSVEQAGLSPDGTKVVTSCWDGTAKLWDATTGNEIRTLSGHTQCVDWAEFSPDGTKVVTAGYDGTVRLWDVETGQQIRSFSGHSGPVHAARFSRDGKKLLTASTDQTAKLWNVETGEEIRTFSGHSTVVWSCAFSPDETKIATGGSYEMTAKVWDLATGKEIRTFAGHEGNVDQVAFSPDGTKLATACHDKVLRLWEVGPAAAPVTAEAAAPAPAVAVRREAEIFINLAPHFNAPMTSFHDKPGDDLTIAQGEHQLEGVHFWVGKGIIWLRGARREDQNLPEKVEGIRAGLKCKKLHFLHATCWSQPEGTQIGSYTIHYEDGSTAELALMYGANIRNWWVHGEPRPDISQGKIAWKGRNERAWSLTGLLVQLYTAAWENPHPDKLVTTIDFTSLSTECAPWLVAVTAETEGSTESTTAKEEKPAPPAPAPTKSKEEVYVPRGATAEGLYDEGSSLRDQGKAKEALQAWRTLIDKFPESQRAGCAAVYMGQLQLSIKDYKGAEESLKLAAEKFGHHRYGNGVEVGGYAYFYLTSLYCDREQYEKAGQALKALVEKYPYASGHRMGDALTSLRAKRWFYDKLKARGIDLKFLDDLIAEQKDPKNYDKMNSRQLYLVAHTLMRDDKDNPRAIQAFLKGVEKFPKESFTPYGAVFALQLQIQEKDQVGAKKTAKLLIERFAEAKAGKSGPLSAIGYYGLGAADFVAEEYKGAVEMFQKVLRDFPGAADMDGVALKQLIAERYLTTLKQKGIEVKGI
jgi:WD40 repeat protein/tetratricopeptide (TPR) repeat protein